MRTVRGELHRSQRGRTGRASAIAEHGDLLISHIVFQCLDVDGIDDPEQDWDAVLAEVPKLAARALTWLIHHVDAMFGTGSYIGSTFTNPERCRALARQVIRDLKSAASVPDLPRDHKPAPLQRRRKPNAVPTLVDAGRLPDGTRLTFVPNSREHEALKAWLAEDPRRAVASWVNDRSKPLLWSADSRRYSPSGLVGEMYKLANWDEAPVAVQGPARWAVPGEGTLAELADVVLADQDLDPQ